MNIPNYSRCFICGNHLSNELSGYYICNSTTTHSLTRNIGRTCMTILFNDLSVILRIESSGYYELYNIDRIILKGYNADELFDLQDANQVKSTTQALMLYS